MGLVKHHATNNHVFHSLPFWSHSFDEKRQTLKILKQQKVIFTVTKLQSVPHQGCERAGQSDARRAFGQIREQDLGFGRKWSV